MIVGHIGKALADPVSLRAMAEGTVPAAHVERNHPRWWAELEAARSIEHTEEAGLASGAELPARPSGIGDPRP